MLAVPGNALYAGGTAGGEDRVVNVGKAAPENEKKERAPIYVHPPRIQVTSTFDFVCEARPTVCWLLFIYPRYIHISLDFLRGTTLPAVSK